MSDLRNAATTRDRDFGQAAISCVLPSRDLKEAVVAKLLKVSKEKS
jgi:hypothetical protein